MHRQLESAPIEVADVQLEQAIVALVAIGTTLAVVALAYFAGFLIGRLAL
jgi:hypothetical protein